MSRRGAYQKKQQNIENIVARTQWLLAGIDKPATLSVSVIPSLANQRSFAALSLPATPIQAIALNTLKSIANVTLARDTPDGRGFAYLDTLRQALKTRTAEHPPARAHATLQRRRECSVDDTRKALRLTEVLNLQRTQAYVDLFSKMVTLLQATCLDDVARLRLYNLLQDHKDLHARLLAPVVAASPESPLRVIPGGKA